MVSDSPTDAQEATGAATTPRMEPRPRAVAAVAEDADSTRLIVIETATGRMTDVAHAEEELRFPVASPDGRRLAFWLDGSARLFDLAESSGRTLQAAPNLDAAKPWSFSPDSTRLAVASANEIQVIDVSGREPVESRRAAASKGCRVFDLLWSPDSDGLAALCYPGPGGSESGLLRIHAGSEDIALRAVQRVNRLLGWRGDTPELVVARSREIPGESAGVFDRSGAFLPMRVWLSGLDEEEQDESGHEILAHLRQPDALVLRRPVEHSTDRISLELAPAGGGEGRPWLEKFYAISELAFTPDGGWAVFVERLGAEDSGSIYLAPTAPTAAEEPEALLRGDLDGVTYRTPAPIR